MDGQRCSLLLHYIVRSTYFALPDNGIENQFAEMKKWCRDYTELKWEGEMRSHTVNAKDKVGTVAAQDQRGQELPSNRKVAGSITRSTGEVKVSKV